jgi:hypothetical protein
MQICVAIVRWHLPTAAAGVAFSEILETKLARGHSASENKTAIAIIRNNVIIRFHEKRNRRERLVAHTGDVEVSFPLTIQILLAQICVPALQNCG